MKFSEALEYRLDMFVYALGSMSEPMVALFVWLAIESGSGSLPYTRGELVTYFLTLLMIRTWTTAWASFFVGDDIRNGKISMYLSKPLSYFGDQLMNNVAEKVQRTIILLPIIVVFALFFGGFSISVVPLQGVAFMVSWLCAAALYFMIDVCIGMLAFWMDEVYSIIKLYMVAGSLFSGRLIPLEFLPGTLHNISMVLPFRFTLSFPLEILLHKLTPTETVLGLGIQLAWLAASIILYKILWKKGLKRYTASGA